MHEDVLDCSKDISVVPFREYSPSEPNMLSESVTAEVIFNY